MTLLQLKVELTKKMEYAKAQAELWAKTPVHSNREQANWVSHWTGKQQAYQDALKLLEA